MDALEEEGADPEAWSSTLQHHLERIEAELAAEFEAAQYELSFAHTHSQSQSAASSPEATEPRRASNTEVQAASESHVRASGADTAPPLHPHPLPPNDTASGLGLPEGHSTELPRHHTADASTSIPQLSTNRATTTGEGTTTGGGSTTAAAQAGRDSAAVGGQPGAMTDLEARFMRLQERHKRALQRPQRAMATSGSAAAAAAPPEPQPATQASGSSAESLDVSQPAIAGTPAMQPANQDGLPPTTTGGVSEAGSTGQLAGTQPGDVRPALTTSTTTTTATTHVPATEATHASASGASQACVDAPVEAPVPAPPTAQLPLPVLPAPCQPDAPPAQPTAPPPLPLSGLGATGNSSYPITCGALFAPPAPMIDTRPLGQEYGAPFTLSWQGANTLQQLLSISSHATQQQDQWTTTTTTGTATVGLVAPLSPVQAGLRPAQGSRYNAPGGGPRLAGSTLDLGQGAPRAPRHGSAPAHTRSVAPIIRPLVTSSIPTPPQPWPTTHSMPVTTHGFGYQGVGAGAAARVSVLDNRREGLESSSPRQHYSPRQQYSPRQPYRPQGGVLQHAGSVLQQRGGQAFNQALAVSAGADLEDLRHQLGELSAQLTQLQCVTEELSAEKECLVAERTATIMGVQAACAALSTGHPSLALEDEVACAAAEARVRQLCGVLGEGSSVRHLVTSSELLPYIKGLREQLLVAHHTWHDQASGLEQQVEQLQQQVKGAMQEVSGSVSASKALESEVSRLQQQLLDQHREAQDRAKQSQEQLAAQRAQADTRARQAASEVYELQQQVLSAESLASGLEQRVERLVREQEAHVRELDQGRQRAEEEKRALQGRVEAQVFEAHAGAEEAQHGLQQELAAARLQAQAAVARLQVMEAENHSLSQQTGQVQLKAARSHDQLTTEVEALREQNLNLKVIVAEAEKQLIGMRSDLDRVRWQQQAMMASHKDSPKADLVRPRSASRLPPPQGAHSPTRSRAAGRPAAAADPLRHSVHVMRPLPARRQAQHTADTRGFGDQQEGAGQGGLRGSWEIRARIAAQPRAR